MLQPTGLAVGCLAAYHLPNFLTTLCSIHCPHAQASEMASDMVYKKHFIPLESNPELFTELVHRLGLSNSFGFHDVLSIDDPELLAFIPRPALALVLVFPTTATYDEHTRDEEQSIEDYAKCGSQEDVMWYKQTINNACGLYGILHAVSNGDAKDYVGRYKRSI
jgi:ubiquitin carboxyl-terminal hydrolase L3